MNRTSRAIVKLRVPILIISVLLLIPAFIGMINCRINYDILSYLPGEIDSMKGQDIMLEDFGKGGYAYVIIEGMDDKDVAKLKSQFEEIDVVSDVVWYDSIADLSIPKEALPDDVYQLFNSDKDDSTLMMVFFASTGSSDESLEAIAQMRKMADKQVFTSGMGAVVEDIKNLTIEEMTMYVIIGVILMSIVLALAMDSLLIPVFFMLNIGISILYNLGTNQIQGQISFVTQALAAVLQLAVTADYSIFLWHSYKEQKEQLPGNKEEAMAIAIRQTFTSVVSSSVTTVAGFLALCFMTFTLGLDIGIVMAKGVVLGVICTITVLPAMILIFDKPLEKTMHRELIPSLDKISNFIVKHSWVFLIAFLALLPPAIYGETHTQVYYNLTDTLPTDLNSVMAASKLSEDYGITSSHIIMVDENMKAADANMMISEMKQVKGVKMAVGLDSVLGMVPDEAIPDRLKNLLKSGGWQMMVVGSEYKVASPEVNAQVDELEDILKKYDKNGMIIGEAAATKDLINITDRDFKIVNALSIAMVFVIIIFALKSISLPIILVSAIEFAVFVNMGLSCYLGTTIPFIASVVIGCIQLGATVDYAILMTTRYKAERLLGKEKHEAVSIALATSIKSILVSAVGFFAATFGVGVYSRVDMISQICTLLSRGALVSMVTVICILPSMLMLLDKVIVYTTLDMRSLRKGKETKYYKLPPVQATADK
ncbi:MAG: MMPL family transporter [Ruminococcus sp.]|nr:MMPL family transporter [Ruminococcus sp.]